MVDLCYYYFETDATDIVSAEQAEARDAVRSSMYRELFDIVYKYGSKSSKTKYIDTSEEPDLEDIPTPLDPFERSKRAVKSYVPPTTIDYSSPLPFGNGIDAPLN
ncbi:hypothetical protein [Actinomycetia phage DSL-LC01]|nr:hypothetical protein [Actinomycetia phage DSL-LC01]